MTDHPGIPSATDQRLNELANEIAILKAEIARLKAWPAKKSASLEAGGMPAQSLEPEADPIGAVSRRHALFALGGAAAGGAGIAIGTALLGGQSAAADDGDDMVLGTTNVAMSTTAITGAIEGPGLSVTNTEATNPSGPAVLGTNAQGTGVSGLGGTSSGIFNTDNPSCGLFGDSSSGFGVIGLSGESAGVFGVSNSNSGYGVAGSNRSEEGGIAVSAHSLNGIGIIGVTASATLFGVVAGNNSNGPSLLLAPSGSATLPSTSSPGSFIVLDDGSLHYCETANEWITLAPRGLSFIPISAERAYDSRVSKGGPGPLGAGATRTVSLTSGGFPAGASAALINLTIVNTVDSGYLTVYEAGGSRPNASNINWYESDQITANNATPLVNPDGEVTVFCSGTGTTDFVVDILGFYQ